MSEGQAGETERQGQINKAGKEAAGQFVHELRGEAERNYSDLLDKGQKKSRMKKIKKL